eukprot:gnl/Spiro4/11591_TR6124_c0_g1_i1.p1 gnl/Spiro4/11591_TR6124_c0_g1~~gnl/Spiro4/11591_TR6124_c0_g1_i1.p1  ORF type:complete len:236 (-),score=42.93 gnl/Spiro4/11591_TR6124_c0_g1_i1:31-738(-)
MEGDSVISLSLSANSSDYRSILSATLRESSVDEIEKVLQEDVNFGIEPSSPPEQIVHVEQPAFYRVHWRILIVGLFAAAAGGLVIFLFKRETTFALDHLVGFCGVFAIFVVLMAMVSRHNRVYCVFTSRRVIYNLGHLWCEARFINLSQIRGTILQRGLFGWLLSVCCCVGLCGFTPPLHFLIEYSDGGVASERVCHVTIPWLSDPVSAQRKLQTLAHSHLNQKAPSSQVMRFSL